MATTDLTIELPKNILSAAKSSARPNQNIEKGEQITQTLTYQVLNNTARNYRNATNITTLLRHITKVEGPLSTAVHTMIEVAATKYTILAYDSTTHMMSPEGVTTAMSVLASMDTPLQYDRATAKKSVDSLIKMMLKEALVTGMISGELVLTEERVPDKFQLVGAETLMWLSDGEGGVYPAQQQEGENDPISLDIPTFFYDHLNPDPDTVVPRSMLESCLKMLIYFEEFLEDIRRNVRVSGHNRLKITLDSTKIAATAPREVQADPEKLTSYLISVKDAVEDQLAGINPEQALVMFDSADADVVNSGHGTKVDYTPLLNVVAGQYATSMKTPPSVLGLRLEGGSQQLGSVETMIFLKTVKALHTPLETVLSRMLTLACRLLGVDVYCWFRFDPVDLRPERELEAFMTMRESRILDRLSLGLISDDEAAIELGTFPRPEGAPLLSGTFFRSGKDQWETHPGDTSMGRELQPDKDAPRKAGGRSQ